jgi:Tfp pilus assembly protein PilX
MKTRFISRHHPRALHHPTARRPLGQNGSALVASLVALTVLALIAAATFQTVTSRFRSNYQTASWHDALTSAESGVQYTIARLRAPLTALPANANSDAPFKIANLLTDPLKVPGTLQYDLANLPTSGTPTSTNGTVLFGTYTDPTTNTPTTFPRIQLPTLTIPHVGEGSSQFNTVVIVDAVPGAGGTGTWYRIQSTGTVPLAGSGNVGIQKYDNLLRKLQFRVDSQGNALTKPQAMRRVEVLAKPVTIGSAALFGQTGIDLNNLNVAIDSYDSRSTLTSTNGQYDATKATKAANIVTDDNTTSKGTTGVINLSNSGAYVYGNIATNNTPVTGNTSNVSGTITTDFYQSLPSPPDPNKVTAAWSNFDPAATSMTPGTATSPAYYRISDPKNGSGDLSMSGNTPLAITAPDANTQYYVSIWIPGDFTTTGNAGISIPTNVHVTFYVDGAVKIAGNGIMNTSQIPGNVTFYGNHDPSVSQTMTIDGNGQFAAMLYAPNATVEAKGGGSTGNMYGAIYANTIKFTGGTALHYDQADGDAGAVIDYRPASWLEDNTLTR